MKQIFNRSTCRTNMTLHGRIADELTTQARPTFIHAVSHIYQEGAVLRTVSLSSFTVGMIGMIPFAGTSRYRRCSGVVSQTVSYPFEVIRCHTQVGSFKQPDHLDGDYQCYICNIRDKKVSMSG
ncbi:hypothetical protein SCLCIDRAFT_369528 [Scleroderma citrinum Foug A]|uniref:Uncharacterized protein n=1 Tax=Scleroderma citrinum Foug A TaxID=1036808 RepID=A0A0C3EEK1_9AGAM|nr:hypothetical protein SCLCIDRAFT_369528 [Scleroderma citrinum Foug A]